MPDPNGLREGVARVLATEKAYDLARICEGFGLTPGDDTNPWDSRRLYVLRCMAGHTEEEAASVAEAVLGSYRAPELREVLNVFRQGGRPDLSELTRRKILGHLASLDDALSGRLDLIEFLERVWPIRGARSEDYRCEDLAGEIWMHMVNNRGDWAYGYLFERLGALSASDRRFMDFLDLCVDPVIRDGGDRDTLIASLNVLLRPDGFAFRPTGQLSGSTVYRVAPLSQGVVGEPKNLIFAAGGHKPDLVLADAINNDVRIVRNAEHCLVYSEPIPDSGLLWLDLVRWWAGQTGADTGPQTERALFDRLDASLASEPEHLFFHRYFKRFRRALGDRLPALVPQVYLHYDPHTVRSRAKGKILPRQRMDFLFLFSAQERVVVEIDGKHHYTHADGRSSPELYAEMVAADRQLRLLGYEVYRFGGQELVREGATEKIDAFLAALLTKHGIA
jgi:very-short-patch-repair endonuclease